MREKILHTKIKWDSAAARLKGKFMGYNAYIRKDKRLRVISKHPPQAARKKTEGSQSKCMCRK